MLTKMEYIIKIGLNNKMQILTDWLISQRLHIDCGGTLI